MTLSDKSLRHPSRIVADRPKGTNLLPATGPIAERDPQVFLAQRVESIALRMLPIAIRTSTAFDTFDFVITYRYFSSTPSLRNQLVACGQFGMRVALSKCERATQG